jgi:hypothetical protein
MMATGSRNCRNTWALNSIQGENRFFDCNHEIPI